jgi:hypothetical protein
VVRSLLVRPHLKLVSKCPYRRYRYNAGGKFAYPLIRRGYGDESATRYGVAGARVRTRKEHGDRSHTNSAGDYASKRVMDRLLLGSSAMRFAGENWLGMSPLYRS